MSQQPATSLPEECWQNKSQAQPLLPGDELTRVPQRRDPVLKLTSWCGQMSLWFSILTHWRRENWRHGHHKYFICLPQCGASWLQCCQVFCELLFPCVLRAPPYSCLVTGGGVASLSIIVLHTCPLSASLALPCSQFLPNPSRPLLFTYCLV